MLTSLQKIINYSPGKETERFRSSYLIDIWILSHTYSGLFKSIYYATKSSSNNSCTKRNL